MCSRAMSACRNSSAWPPPNAFPSSTAHWSADSMNFSSSKAGLGDGSFRRRRLNQTEQQLGGAPHAGGFDELLRRVVEGTSLSPFGGENIEKLRIRVFLHERRKS